MCLLQTIDIAASIHRLQLSGAVPQYICLQNSLPGGVALGTDYSRRFNRFYRVRRGKSWQTQFYGYFRELQAARADDALPPFRDALAEMQKRTGRLEASFTSKLLATLDTSRPVLDRNVISILGLRLPYWHQTNRLDMTDAVFSKLSLVLASIMQCQHWQKVEADFDCAFAEVGMASIKKLDLILWKSYELHRPKTVSPL